MKRIIYIIITIIITSISVEAQQQQAYEVPIKHKEEGKFDENSKKTGEWKTYYDNGQLLSIGNYENGERTGSWK